MPIHFEAAHGSSIDNINNIEIFQPRMRPKNSFDEVEFQYSIYQGEKRYGLGCHGTSRQSDNQPDSARIVTLDLGEDWVIGSMLKIKQRINNHDDDFKFIMELSRGLILVFKSRADNTGPVQYLALTKDSALAAHGLSINGFVKRLPTNELILSEIYLPAQRQTGLA